VDVAPRHQPRAVGRLVAALEKLRNLGCRSAALERDDGVIRDVDVAGELWGAMFEPLRDSAFFAQVFVDHGPRPGCLPGPGALSGDGTDTQIGTT
jgi:hypothetical protein